MGEETEGRDRGEIGERDRGDRHREETEENIQERREKRRRKEEEEGKRRGRNSGEVWEEKYTRGRGR
jgi:hypothetical protein